MNTNFKETKLPRPNNSRLENLWGVIPTVTVKPAYIPRNFSEQLVIWNDAGTRKLAIYDIIGKAWLGVTLSSL
jgi:hypothetical protein